MYLKSLLIACCLSSPALANIHKKCMSGLLTRWVEDQRIPLQVRTISQSVSRSTVKLHDHDFWECNIDYDNDGYVDEQYCETNEWHQGEPEFSDRTFQVWGNNLQGNVEFQLEFTGEFWTYDRTRFGSGDVQSGYTCCVTDRSITIHDTTSGFSQAFDTNGIRCGQVRADIESEASRNSEIVKFDKSEKLLCEDFGRPVQRWKTKEHVYVSPHGFVDKYSTHTGCKKLGSPSDGLRWSFVENAAEIQDSFDRKFTLGCEEKEIRPMLQLSRFDQSLLKQLSQSSDYEINVSTNRSSSYRLRDYAVDLESQTVSFTTPVDSRFLRDFRADSSFEVEILSANGELMKKAKFSLKGSSRAIRSLERACR